MTRALEASAYLATFCNASSTQKRRLTQRGWKLTEMLTARALADGTRRAIVASLAYVPRTVGQLAVG